MPSKHRHSATNGYRVVSELPSVDGKTVLKTFANDKGETLVRIVDKDKINAVENVHSQNKTSIKKSKSKHTKKKSDSVSNQIGSADSVTYIAGSGSNANQPKTRAHHVLYTKTSTATIYKKPEESSLEAYTTRRISRNRTSEMDSALGSQDTGNDTSIPIYRKINDLEINDVQEKKVSDQENNSQLDFHNESETSGNDKTVNGDKNSKNFKEEADKLIKEYKRKFGSRDSLLDKSDTDSVDRQVNDKTVQEFLKEKTVVISQENNDGTTNRGRNKITSTQSLKINRKYACFHCGETVYQKEKVGPIRDVLFHTQCFRCSICGTVLTLYNFYQNHKDMRDRSVYCKSHQPYTESSKGDIADKNIQAVINKPKLGRVNSNVRGGPDSKSSIGTDAISIKNAMNAPKLGTYNPTVRVTFDSGSSEHIDHRAVFVQTAMKAPKLDVYNSTVRPVPPLVQRTQSAKVSRQRDELDGQAPEPPRNSAHFGTNAVHSLYLHKP